MSTRLTEASTRVLPLNRGSEPHGTEGHRARRPDVVEGMIDIHKAWVQARGVITMHVSDLVGDDLDPDVEELVVVFNATPDEVTQTVDEAVGPFSLHPIQAGGPDPVVQTATADGATFTVPARTVAVFVSP